jgi:hypothetical protein
MEGGRQGVSEGERETLVGFGGDERLGVEPWAVGC